MVCLINSYIYGFNKYKVLIKSIFKLIYCLDFNIINK